MASNLNNPDLNQECNAVQAGFISRKYWFDLLAECLGHLRVWSTGAQVNKYSVRKCCDSSDNVNLFYGDESDMCWVMRKVNLTQILDHH